jgi:hypothetical protein
MKEESKKVTHSFIVFPLGLASLISVGLYKGIYKGLTYQKEQDEEEEERMNGKE